MFLVFVGCLFGLVELIRLGIWLDDWNWRYWMAFGFFCLVVCDLWFGFLCYVEVCIVFVASWLWFCCCYRRNFGILYILVSCLELFLILCDWFTCFAWLWFRFGYLVFWVRRLLVGLVVWTAFGCLIYCMLALELLIVGFPWLDLLLVLRFWWFGLFCFLVLGFGSSGFSVCWGGVCWFWCSSGSFWCLVLVRYRFLWIWLFWELLIFGIWFSGF